MAYYGALLGNATRVHLNLKEAWKADKSCYGDDNPNTLDRLGSIKRARNDSVLILRETRGSSQGMMQGIQYSHNILPALHSQR